MTTTALSWYEDGLEPSDSSLERGGAIALIGSFDDGDPFASSNVIGMPGITSAAADLVMELRSFDEMPKPSGAARAQDHHLEPDDDGARSGSARC